MVVCRSQSIDSFLEKNYLLKKKNSSKNYYFGLRKNKLQETDKLSSNKTQKLH